MESSLSTIETMSTASPVYPTQGRFLGHLPCFVLSRDARPWSSLPPSCLSFREMHDHGHPDQPRSLSSNGESLIVKLDKPWHSVGETLP
jgi:hypothetical protein